MFDVVYFGYRCLFFITKYLSTPKLRNEKMMIITSFQTDYKNNAFPYFFAE